jgi:hypothetical protein
MPKGMHEGTSSTTVQSVLPPVMLQVDTLEVTEYRVLFAGGTPSSANIKAEKVNLGLKKLWFYDAEDHLVAVYQWDKLIGLDVVGSASEQSFTDSLLHENRPLPDVERARAIEGRGLLLVLLEEALASLNGATNAIRSQWTKVNTEVRNKTQTQLLVEHREATLRGLQAGLIDGNKELQKILGLLQTEFQDMGLQARTVKPSPIASPASAAETNAQEKKKWFS